MIVAIHLPTKTSHTTLSAMAGFFSALSPARISENSKSKYLDACIAYGPSLHFFSVSVTPPVIIDGDPDVFPIFNDPGALVFRERSVGFEADLKVDTFI